MSRDAETVKVYDAQANKYADMVHSEANDLRLGDFISRIPAGGYVLDLGCGPGAQAARMQSSGLSVFATDASAEMAAVANEKFGVDVVIGTFDDIIQRDTFDGIWASFSLLHAPRADMPRHLNSLQTAIKPGGTLFIGLKTGSGEHRDSLGRRYTYYLEGEITELLTDAGFTVIESQTGADVGLDGVVAPWVCLVAHA